jgi:predicted dehydrogenase
MAIIAEPRDGLRDELGRGLGVMRVVLCGFGRFGRFYAQRVVEHSDMELVGVVEVGGMLDEVRLAGHTAFGALGEAISATHPHLVIVATPPEHHALLGIYALQRFCDVLMAKPGALGLDQAERLATTAWQRHRLLFVDYTPRVSAAWQAVRDATGDDEVVTARLVRRGMHTLQECGALWDLAPHDVALALDLQPDDEVVRVSARGWWNDPAEQPVGAWLHLEHGSGRATRIEVDWVSAITERRVEIVQRECLIVWDQIADTVSISDKPDAKPIPIDQDNDNVTRALDKVIAQRKAAADDSHTFLNVMRVLEQAEASMYATDEVPAYTT